MIIIWFFLLKDENFWEESWNLKPQKSENFEIFEIRKFENLKIFKIPKYDHSEDMQKPQATGDSEDTPLPGMHSDWVRKLAGPQVHWQRLELSTTQRCYELQNPAHVVQE